MNRRTILTSLAALPFIGTAFTAAKAEPPIETIDGLVDHIESRFNVGRLPLNTLNMYRSFNGIGKRHKTVAAAVQSELESFNEYAKGKEGGTLDWREEPQVVYMSKRFNAENMAKGAPDQSGYVVWMRLCISDKPPLVA